MANPYAFNKGANTKKPPPRVTLNVTNVNTKSMAKAHPENLLPDPEFYSPSEIRTYCNAVRALMTGLAFEISMAAEILQATLAQVPDPEGKPWGSRARARRVTRKLAKSADATRAAAVNAAACYGRFQQEYQEEINRVRHRARRRQGRPMDWASQ